MLLANRTVAAHVSKIKINKKPIPFPYRIHDTPDEEKLKPFVAFAKKFGYKFDMNDEAEVAASFNQLLQDVHGKPEQHVLGAIGHPHYGKSNLYFRKYWPLWLGF